MGVAEQTRNELYCPTCEQTFDSGDRCPTDNTRLVRIATPVDSLIGRELDGRYTIVEKLGQGGMGSVYRGTQHSVGREVAIKVVTPALVAERDVIKRFLREAKLASRLAHPNAVAVLDFGQTEDNLFYLVMELVVGRTLDRLLADVGTLPPARLVRIGVQICDALEGAHALQIVHRDLKPQNVMVLSTGRDLVKVLDFGIAKSLTPQVAGTTVTNAGALLGTPAYMPPELVSGGACDARADLYSLGCLLFAAGTGRLPFEASSVNELIAMHACEPAPPAAGLPPRLAAAIGRLLEKDPARRYPTAAATRDALEAALADGAHAPEREVERDTVLGWSGQFTVPAKGPKRPATPPTGRPVITARAVPASPISPSQSTPMPSARIGARSLAAAEQHELASSATLPADAIRQELAAVPPPKKKSRAVIWIVGGAGALAASVVAFALLRNTDTEAPPAAPQETPAPNMTTTPSAPAPTPPSRKADEAPREPEPPKPPPARTRPTPQPTDSRLTTPIPTPTIGRNDSGGEGSREGAPSRGADTMAVEERPPSTGGAPARGVPKTLPSRPAAEKKQPDKKQAQDPPRKPVTINPGINGE